MTAGEVYGPTEPQQIHLSYGGKYALWLPYQVIQFIPQWLYTHTDVVVSLGPYTIQFWNLAFSSKTSRRCTHC